MFDRMPPEKLARAKGQAANTNKRNELAHKANGFETTRAGQKQAEQQLVAEVGRSKAKKLIKEAGNKAARGGWF